MKNIIHILFPIISHLKRTMEYYKPYFCKHQMRYWDMKFIVEDEKSHIYNLDGEVWPNSFCECQKCGVMYRKIYLPKRWGEWEKSEFIPNKTNVIEVEIYELGKISKSQKRDILLDQILTK